MTVERYNVRGIREFERHSRLGMVDEDEFYKTVEHLRRVGAKRVSLKTGAYRPVDLARAVKFASQAKIDLLTVDGAGGGTGMSPWRMMNEWGIPTVHLECLLYEYLGHLETEGRVCPDGRHRRRPFPGRPCLQGPGPGRPLYQAGLHGPLHHDRGHGGHL